MTKNQDVQKLERIIDILEKSENEDPITNQEQLYDKKGKYKESNC